MALFHNLSDEARRAALRDTTASGDVGSATNEAITFIRGMVSATLVPPMEVWNRLRYDLQVAAEEVSETRESTARLIRQLNPWWLPLTAWITALATGDYLAARDIIEGITREPLALLFVPALLVVGFVFGFGWLRRSLKEYWDQPWVKEKKISMIAAVIFTGSMVVAVGWMRFQDWTPVVDSPYTGVTIAILTIAAACAPGIFIEGSLRPTWNSLERTWAVIQALAMLSVAKHRLRILSRRESRTIREAGKATREIWQVFHAYNEVWLSRMVDKERALLEIKDREHNLHVLLGNLFEHILEPTQRTPDIGESDTSAAAD